MSTTRPSAKCTLTDLHLAQNNFYLIYPLSTKTKGQPSLTCISAVIFKRASFFLVTQSSFPPLVQSQEGKMEYAYQFRFFEAFESPFLFLQKSSLFKPCFECLLLFASALKLQINEIHRFKYTREDQRSHSDKFLTSIFDSLNRSTSTFSSYRHHEIFSF